MSEKKPKAITNRRLIDSDGPDFYPTPEWATRALLIHERIGGHVWEPAAGDGAMLRVLRDHVLPCYQVFGSDLYPRGNSEIKQLDFLSDDAPGYSSNGDAWGAIVTNPPYHSAEEFIKKALRLSAIKVAMLLRLQFLEGAKRQRSLFFHTPPQRVWIFSERLTFYPAGETPKGGGTTAYAWFIWDKALPKMGAGSSSILNWIPAGTKAAIERDGKPLFR